MNKINVGKDLYLKGRIGWRGLSKNEYLNYSNYRIINGTSLEDKFIDWEICGYITKERYQESPEIQLKENDILISKDGTLGKIGYVKKLEKPSTVASGIFVLRNIKEKFLNTDYLYHFLKSEIFKNFVFRNKALGSTINHLYQRDLEELEIELPSLNEQIYISRLLNCIDSKIELNNRINTELEAMAKTLYDYWFVQFDFPDENGKPYKTSGGKMVWNEELKREIPDGWEVFKVGNLLYTSLGGTPSTKKKEFWENGTIHWLNSGEIANFPIVESELKITEEAIRNSATELMPKGSVLISITRHLRPSVLAIDACANQSVVGIKEKGDLKYYYIFPFLKNEIPRFNSLRTGAQQPHINKETIEESFMLVPNQDSSILKIYNSKAEPLYKLIINNAFQNQKLSGLRDWLLPMLMNGQVRVG